MQWNVHVGKAHLLTAALTAALTTTAALTAALTTSAALLHPSPCGALRRRGPR